MDGLVGSPCTPRDSQESSPTPQFESINSLALNVITSGYRINIQGLTSPHPSEPCRGQCAEGSESHCLLLQGQPHLRNHSQGEKGGSWKQLPSSSWPKLRPLDADGGDMGFPSTPSPGWCFPLSTTSRVLRMECGHSYTRVEEHSGWSSGINSIFRDGPGQVAGVGRSPGFLEQPQEPLL